MVRYVIGLGAAAIGIMLAGFIILMIFTNTGMKYGLGGALLVVGGIMIIFAWYWDRKQRRRRGDLPPV
jgi:hypothetical protein